MRPLFIFTTACCLTLACAPPQGTGGGGGERRNTVRDAGSAPGDAGTLADAGPTVHDGPCDSAGFRVNPGQATLGAAAQRAPAELMYRAQSSGEPYDLLRFSTTLRPDEDTLAVGRYNLPEATEGNAAELVLRAYRDCETVEGDEACNQTYQADGGTLVVTRSGGVGERFAAHLENVTFIEMERDGSRPGGRQRSFCGSPLRWDAQIEAPPTPPVLGNCLAEGEGSAKGDRLRDLVLPNCYGNLVALHDNCGHVKAQVVVLGTLWCSACRVRVPQTEALVQRYKNQGQEVEAYYVLGQGDRMNSFPSAQQCREFADSHDIDPARVLLDTDGGRNAFHETWRGGWADTCDNGTPYYLVLDGDDMSYNFGSRCGDDPRSEQGYTAAIEELLAAP